MEVNQNPFYELRNRLYAVAITGCSLIGEDFRLQRAVEAFKPISETNKVFEKLYNMCSALMKSEQPAADLPDCIALADALAVTQGTFAVNAETTPAEPNPCISAKNIPYSKLTAYQTMIRKSRTSHADFDKPFYDEWMYDVRLLNTYLEIADSQSSATFYTTEAFTDAYGEALVMPLLHSIDFSDSKANGQQITQICNIAGAAQNQLYISLAENENNPQGVRVKAIKAMSCSMENEELLEKLYRTGKGKIKAAALHSLAILGSKKADEPLKAFLSKLKPQLSDSDRNLISASSGNVFLDYINQKIDFMIEREASVFYQIEMLMNKADTYDAFKKIADYAMKNVEDADTAPYLIQVNQVLVSNLYYHNEPAYRELITKLYDAKPDFFFFSKFFLELIEHPESACTAMNDGNQSTISNMLSVLKFIYYNHQNQYKLKYRVQKYYSDAEYEKIMKPIFTSVPDDMLKFLTDTTGIRKGLCWDQNDHEYKQFLQNAHERQNILNDLLQDCFPTDQERLRNAASDYAWTLFDSGQKFDTISFLIAYSNKSLQGIVKNCVYTALSYNLSGYISLYYIDSKSDAPSVLGNSFFTLFEDCQDILISDLKELAEELPENKEFDAKQVSAQLNVIYRVLDEYGVVYERK